MNIKTNEIIELIPKCRGWTVTLSDGEFGFNFHFKKSGHRKETGIVLFTDNNGDLAYQKIVDGEVNWSITKIKLKKS